MLWVGVGVPRLSQDAETCRSRGTICRSGVYPRPFCHHRIAGGDKPRPYSGLERGRPPPNIGGCPYLNAYGRKPGSSAVKLERIGVLSTAPGHPGLDSDFRRNDGELGLVLVFRPSRKTSGSNTSPYLRHGALSREHCRAGGGLHEKTPALPRSSQKSLQSWCRFFTMMTRSRYLPCRSFT